jgi:hypothetical protein
MYRETCAQRIKVLIATTVPGHIAGPMLSDGFTLYLYWLYRAFAICRSRHLRCRTDLQLASAPIGEDRVLGWQLPRLRTWALFFRAVGGQRGVTRAATVTAGGTIPVRLKFTSATRGAWRYCVFDETTSFVDAKLVGWST